jgi:hypothetical protein
MMSLVVEEDKALNPFPVSALGSGGIMLKAHDFTDLVEQLEFGIWNEAGGPL